MKKLIIIFVTILMATSCQEKETRYTQNSPEIDTYKALIADYESGNWDGYKSHYAENAVVYRNSLDSITVQEVIEDNKETLAAMSSYGFVDGEGDLEMVVTDKGETWVNFWGQWKGTMKANNQEFNIPVHITAKFENGKIVKSHGYWDNAPMMKAQMELEMAEAAKMADSTGM
jgi:ketosteroid isomerase-like protein